MDWRTPKAIYDELDKEFHFDNDPCPPYPTDDGLKGDWGLCNFVNPPYGREVGMWVKKACEEWHKGKTVVMLLASRTDTIWFHDYILKADEIRFIKGRLKFDDQKNPAPFPSMIVIFRGKKE